MVWNIMRASNEVKKMTYFRSYLYSANRETGLRFREQQHSDVERERKAAKDYIVKLVKLPRRNREAEDLQRSKCKKNTLFEIFENSKRLEESSSNAAFENLNFDVTRM